MVSLGNLPKVAIHKKVFPTLQYILVWGPNCEVCFEQSM